jgi:hypothetical protein
MMKSTRTCCALTRLDPIILKVPSVTCWGGCPGAGNVVDWTYDIPKKRERMYSEDEKVPIDKGVRERRERKGLRREVKK